MSAYGGQGNASFGHSGGSQFSAKGFAQQGALAGAGFLGDIAGAGISFGLGQAAANAQWDRMKDAWVKGPGYRVMGLRRAGLNPILAARGGLGAGGGPSLPAVASGGQGGPSGSKAAELFMRSPLVRAQTADAQAGASAKGASAQLSLAQARVADATAAEIKARTPRHAVDISHIRQQIRESQTRVSEIGTRAGLNRSQQAKAQLEAERIWRQMTSERVMQNLWSTLDPQTQTDWAAVMGVAATVGAAAALGPGGLAGKAGRAAARKVWSKATPQVRRFIAKRLKVSPRKIDQWLRPRRR